MLGPFARDVPHLLAAAALAGLIAGLLAVERKGVLQLLLARPLVLAPLLGLAIGDVEGGLLLGVPLELLTLGGVSLGASTPANETTLASALTALVVTAGLWSGTGVDEALAALGLLLTAPLGLAGQRLERWAEGRNVLLAERAALRAAAGEADFAASNLRGLAWPFLFTAAVAFALVLLGPGLSLLRAACPPRAVAGLTMAWHLVWALSAAAAVRAIRHPRGPALSALAAAAVAAAAALTRVLG